MKERPKEMRLGTDMKKIVVGSCALLGILVSSCSHSGNTFFDFFKVPPADAQSSSEAPVGTAPAWVSNPVYAKQLGPAVKVDNFSISPPAGYRLEKTQKKGKFNIHDEFKWVSPKRADGSTATFRVEVYNWLPGVPDDGTSEQWLTRGLGVLNKSSRNPVHSPITEGEINGMDFARAYWKENPKPSDKGPASHGFEYISSQGPILISVICGDIAPHYKSTLDLMEASALTLHE
jgi:hypothetical protein